MRGTNICAVCFQPKKKTKLADLCPDCEAKDKKRSEDLFQKELDSIYPDFPDRTEQYDI